MQNKWKFSSKILKNAGQGILMLDFFNARNKIATKEITAKQEENQSP